MEQFKCYGYYKDQDADKCYNQCTVCERKELLAKSDNAHINDHMRAIVTEPFVEYRENECFTKEDMFFFAGFCTGYRERFPKATANEMFDIWCATFKTKKV